MLDETPAITPADVYGLRADGWMLLDVRTDDEWAQGRIDGSVHIPIHEVLTRLDEIPTGTVWVHCAGGYRASVAAALLDARGFDVVAVNDAFACARAAGLPLTSERA